MPASTPTIYVFTGTSGSGRKTVARKVADGLGWTAVRSCTTRPPRNPANPDGDYHYVTREQFDLWDSEGKFAQTADIDGNRYGILRNELDTMLAGNHTVYLVLNRAGADAIVKLYGDRVVRIFIYVDKTTVRERLETKGTPFDVVERYLDHYSEEVTYRTKCEHVFENVNADRTVDLIKQAIAR